MIQRHFLSTGGVGGGEVGSGSGILVIIVLLTPSRVAGMIYCMFIFPSLISWGGLIESSSENIGKSSLRIAGPRLKVSINGRANSVTCSPIIHNPSLRTYLHGQVLLPGVLDNMNELEPIWSMHLNYLNLHSEFNLTCIVPHYCSSQNFYPTFMKCTEMNTWRKLSITWVGNKHLMVFILMRAVEYLGQKITFDE